MPRSNRCASATLGTTSRGTSKVRRSTIAVIGVLALLGGIAMAMTDALGSGIGLFTVGGLFLMTLFR